MMLKWIGAVLIILGSGGFGFSLAAAHCREERHLQQMIRGLDFMQCELQYNLTPLPVLCRQTAGQVSGVLQKLFLNLANELEDQISPDAEHCMMAALYKTQDIPGKCREAAQTLGKTMGRFDLEGQLNGLDSVRSLCRGWLEQLSDGREIRLRNYETLGLCAGAALVILFI
jgi:stage III sporulation protein AB